MPVFSTKKTARVVVSVCLMVGMCTFIADILNPLTPTPQIWLRVAALAQLVFAAIKLLMPILGPIPQIVYLTRSFLPREVALDVHYLDPLALTCVQLR